MSSYENTHTIIYYLTELTILFLVLVVVAFAVVVAVVTGVVFSVQSLFARFLAAFCLLFLYASVQVGVVVSYSHQITPPYLSC